MSMTIREMYEDHDFHTITNKIRGFRARQRYEMKNNVMVAFEAARYQVFHLVNIQLKREDRLKDVKQITVFDWEKPLAEKNKKITPEQFREMVRRQ